MKVVSRQASWQSPHSPPSPGNAVCSWLNGVGEVCTHFHPFGKFLSNGKTEKLLHGKTSHHLHEFTNCHASAFYDQHRVKKYMEPWINGLLSASHRNIKLAVHAKSLAPVIGYGTRTRFLSPPDTRFHLTQKLLAHGTRVIRHAAGKIVSFSKERATI